MHSRTAPPPALPHPRSLARSPPPTARSARQLRAPPQDPHIHTFKSSSKCSTANPSEGKGVLPTPHGHMSHTVTLVINFDSHHLEEHWSHQKQSASGTVQPRRMLRLPMSICVAGHSAFALTACWAKNFECDGRCTRYHFRHLCPQQILQERAILQKELKRPHASPNSP